ncbi:MAG: rRNA maturation RNase YbeY [Muribaculaceae bacterium]|nr:rRNA maturation RNase YbeY [Muribaculaceae bacterium]
MSHISLQTERVELPRFNETVLARWIECVVDAHGKQVGTLTYVFCDDEYILAVNKQFLQHDYYTDIITFDYSTRRRVSGDMVISLDTVRSNAELFGRDYSEELLRVVIHGVLHLCGINDKGPGEREVMEQHENEALALISQPLLLNDD